MLINGKLVEGRGGAFANINPATEELLGEVSDASCEDMALGDRCGAGRL